MNIFAHVGTDPNAVPYYRVATPLAAMADLDLGEFLFDDDNRLVTDSERWTNMLISDVYYGCFPVTFGRFKSFAPFAKVKPDTATGMFPPACVVDIDDDMWNVHPTNTSFAAWGYKDFDGQPLAEGGAVYVQLPNGKIEPVWEDGKPYADEKVYSLELVKQNLRDAQNLIASASGVVTTSDYLRGRIQAETGAKHVYVYPNCINFSHFDKVELRDHPDELRIMWRGGSSHFLDLAEVADTLVSVVSKYPHVKFMLFGQAFPFLEDKFKPEQFEYVHWVPFERYRLRLSTLNHDITILPLADTVFNRGKTPIAWYESAAISKPAACLAARVGPNEREMVDGETALLYNTPEEFGEKLSTLIEDATLRQQLAKNSVDWLHENRDVYKRAHDLYDFIEESQGRYLKLRSKYHDLSNSVQSNGTEPANVAEGSAANRAGIGIG